MIEFVVIGAAVSLVGYFIVDATIDCIRSAKRLNRMESEEGIDYPDRKGRYEDGIDCQVRTGGSEEGIDYPDR